MREEASEPRGPQARTPTPPLFPATTSPSVAKGVVWARLFLQVLAIDGQLIVRARHRSGKSNAHLCGSYKGISFKPLLSYDPFLDAEG